MENEDNNPWAAIAELEFKVATLTERVRVLEDNQQQALPLAIEDAVKDSVWASLKNSIGQAIPKGLD